MSEMDKGLMVMRKMIRLLLLSVLAASTASAQRTGMVPEDLHALRSVGDVALRGDGKAILYTETDPSGPYRATSNLMLYDRDSKRSRVFRQSGEGGVHARWSPDGSKVALLGVEGDRFGLIVTDASGGSERFLAPVSGTNHPLPSSGERLAWSPDSSSIAYMSSEPGPESADATGDPVVIRRYLYKPTAATGDTRFNDNRRTHIFFVSASGGSVRQLTEGHLYLFTADAGVGAGQKRPPRLSYSTCSGPGGSRFANWANGLNGLRASWVD